jgi:hypothetical protein
MACQVRYAMIADQIRIAPKRRYVPKAEVAAPVRSPVATGEQLAALVIRAAQPAAILLGIARGLRPADEAPARL